VCIKPPTALSLENANLLKRFNAICPVQPQPQKYSCFRLPQISSRTRPFHPSTRGVGHRHERWDGMRWTRQCRRAIVTQGELRLVNGSRRARRTALKRTAKPCGPGTRCWCQVGGGMSAQPGAGMPLICR
jgi:hypothetical protein